jgi:hypothetical protein
VLSQGISVATKHITSVHAEYLTLIRQQKKALARKELERLPGKTESIKS